VSNTDNSNSQDNSKQKKDETKAAAEKSHRPRRAHKKDSPSLVTSLLVIIIIGGLAGGVWLHRTIQNNNVKQEDALNDVRDKLRTTQQQTQQQVDELQQRLQQQQQAQAELSDNLSTLLKRNEHLRKDWLVGEAEYLIKLASYRLQLQRDVTTALRAMQAADERLRDIGDPALVSVRKVIAEDQNALRNVPTPDITGMSLTLSALLENVDKLPLNTPEPATVAGRDTQAATEKHINNWKELPGAIWQDLKELVTIRHHDQNISALLSPKEHFYLTQNLRLQIEQARLALLLGKADVYGERMKTAQEWLSRFFDKDDPAVQNTLQTLAKLAEADIEPKIPDVNKSYQALRSYLAGAPVEKSTAPKETPAPAKAADKAETQDQQSTPPKTDVKEQ
jgi:uroporphyrin-3 C-methyltransferase